MGLTAFVTPKELQRQCDAVFTGRNIKVWAVNDPAGNLGLETTAAEWEAARVSVIIEGTIGGGTYNLVRERYEMPPVVARFESGNNELQFNKIAVQIDDADYLHSVQIEEPGILLPPGMFRTYLIYVAQDDGPNEAIPIYKASEFGSFMLWGTHTQWHKTWPDSSLKVRPVQFKTTGYRSQWSKIFPFDSTKAEPGLFGLTGGEAVFNAPDAHNWLHAQRGQIWLTGQQAGYTITGGAAAHTLACVEGTFVLDGYPSTGSVNAPEPPEPPAGPTIYQFSTCYVQYAGEESIDEPGELVFASGTSIVCNPVDDNGLDLRESGFATGESGTPVWVRFDTGPLAGQWDAHSMSVTSMTSPTCIFFQADRNMMWTSGGVGLAEIAFEDPEAGSGPPLIDGDPPEPGPDAPDLSLQQIFEWSAMHTTTNDPPDDNLIDEQRKGAFVIDVVGAESTTHIYVNELDNHGVNFPQSFDPSLEPASYGGETTIGPGSIYLTVDWLAYDLREFNYESITFRDEALPDNLGSVEIKGLDAADGSGPFVSYYEGQGLANTTGFYVSFEPRPAALPYPGMTIYVYHRFSDWPGGASEGLPPAAMMQDPGQAVWFGEYPSNDLVFAVQDGYGRTLGNLEPNTFTAAMGAMISVDKGETWNYFHISGGLNRITWSTDEDFTYVSGIYQMPDYNQTGIETADGDYSGVEELWLAIPSPDQLRTTKIDKRKRKPWPFK